MDDLNEGLGCLAKAVAYVLLALALGLLISRLL
jgi:hypothetical protein